MSYNAKYLTLCNYNVTKFTVRHYSRLWCCCARTWQDCTWIFLLLGKGHPFMTSRGVGVNPRLWTGGGVGRGRVNVNVHIKSYKHMAMCWLIYGIKGSWCHSRIYYGECTFVHYFHVTQYVLQVAKYEQIIYYSTVKTMCMQLFPDWFISAPLLIRVIRSRLILYATVAATCNAIADCSRHQIHRLQQLHNSIRPMESLQIKGQSQSVIYVDLATCTCHPPLFSIEAVSKTRASWQNKVHITHLCQHQTILNTAPSAISHHVDKWSKTTRPTSPNSSVWHVRHADRVTWWILTVRGWLSWFPEVVFQSSFPCGGCDLSMDCD